MTTKAQHREKPISVDYVEDVRIKICVLQVIVGQTGSQQINDNLSLTNIRWG